VKAARAQRKFFKRSTKDQKKRNSTNNLTKTAHQRFSGVPKAGTRILGFFGEAQSFRRLSLFTPRISVSSSTPLLYRDDVG
jgi:hypothetical protein